MMQYRVAPTNAHHQQVERMGGAASKEYFWLMTTNPIVKCES